MTHETTGKNQDIVLKGGLVVDGSGEPPFTANVLLRGGKIHKISPKPVRTTGTVIDCTGRVVAPGFIDVHSHLDWEIPMKGHEETKYPFMAQGITTVVAGTCGSAAVAFREASIWKGQVESHQIGAGHLAVQWASVSELFERLASSGTSHNIALLAGHGSTRLSIRGADPSPLHPYETKELLWLLEKALDEGARGVTLGLHLAPGMFGRPDELKEVAQLVKRKGKILAVHPRTSVAISPGVTRRLGQSHNLDSLREILDLARDTGVRLQISGLGFLGSRTWRTAGEALSMIDAAQSLGVDVRFDMQPMHCMATVVSELLPAWFRARGAEAWADAGAVHRVRRELRRAYHLAGFGPADILVTDVRDEDLSEYNGRFLGEIARLRRMGQIEVLMDLACRSGGRAKIIARRLNSDRVVEALMAHPASLFGTGAWVEREGVQNPAAFGAFPRLLQIAREKRVLRLEDVVRKMSGAAAERFGLSDRGLLREGMAADVVVFDWEGVADATSEAEPDAAPSGIDYVFVNGTKIIGSGKKEMPLISGVPLQ